MSAPRISHDEVKSILVANGCDVTKACWLAIRGYFLDTVGKPGVNDRNYWDDAWCLYSPQHGVVTYRANTDPTGYKPGKGTDGNKGRASLAPGVWLYGEGAHKGRPAFRQCAQVLVYRDDTDGTPYPHWGTHAINIHDSRGSSTSSEGCQTIKTAQFLSIRPLFVQWMKDAGNKKARNDWGQSVLSFEYVLIDETERRKGNVIAPNRYRKF